MGGIWGSKKKAEDQAPPFLEVGEPGSDPQAWDEALVALLLEDFHKRQRIDLKRDEIARTRLHAAAERARQELGTAASTRVTLPFIAADASGPKTLDVEIRKKFR